MNIGQTPTSRVSITLTILVFYIVEFGVAEHGRMVFGLKVYG